MQMPCSSNAGKQARRNDNDLLTIIVVIGFYIIHWETSVMVKYSTLGTLSFIVIIAMYDLLIKRGSLLRFMFGMKKQTR